MSDEKQDVKGSKMATDGSTDDREKFLSLPIPSRFYEEVLLYLATLRAAELNGPTILVSESEQPHADELSFRGWTRPDVRRLSREVANPGVRAVFELPLRNGKETVSMRELMDYTSRTSRQISGDMAGLSRRTKRDFSSETWPFMPSTGDDGLAEYRIPRYVQEWWQEG